jgi:predicted secreted protein
MPGSGSSGPFIGLGTQLQYGNGCSPETFTTVALLKTVQKSGAKAGTEDVTTMDNIDGKQRFIGTLIDEGEYSLAGIFSANDTTQAELESIFQSRLANDFKIVLPPFGTYATSLGNWAFSAIITGIDIELQHDKASTISIKLKVSGGVTWTAGS